VSSMQKVWDTFRRRSQQHNQPPHQQQTSQSHQQDSPEHLSPKKASGSSTPLRHSPLRSKSSAGSDLSPPPSPSLFVSLAKRLSASFERSSETTRKDDHDGEGGGKGKRSCSFNARPTGLCLQQTTTKPFDIQENNSRRISSEYQGEGEVSACSSSSFLLWERHQKEKHYHHERTQKDKYDEQDNKSEEEKRTKTKHVIEEIDQDVHQERRNTFFTGPGFSVEITRDTDDEDTEGSSSSLLSSLLLSPIGSYSTASEERDPLRSGVTVISLEVPILPKSGRSASMDSSYLQVPRRHDVLDFESVPGKSNRSRSVDIALPVGPDGPYIIVPSEKPIPATTQ
jgi:hypothetical protein